MAVELAYRTRRRFAPALLIAAVEATLSYRRCRGDVSVAIVGDTEMKRLNRSYRGFDKVTDVLSFVEKEAEAATPDFLGELVIDLEQIRRQAKNFGHGIRWELAFIAIHGTLHLLGYEDETEKGRKEMERLGNSIIKKLNLK